MSTTSTHPLIATPHDPDEQLQTSITVFQAEFARLHYEIGARDEWIKSLLLDQEELVEDVERLKRANAELVAEKDAFENQNEELRAEIERLDENVEALEWDGVGLVNLLFGVVGEWFGGVQH